MSSCITDLFDYDLVKKCLKCGTIPLKSNFHENKTKIDGFRPRCKIRRKKYYVDNKDRLLNKQKIFNKENHDQINEYQLKNHDKFIARKKISFKIRYKTDNSFRLISETRSRILNALNCKLKSSSSKQISGIDIDLLIKWIEYQFTPEMKWLNFEIDHVKPICMFDVSKDEE